MSKLNVGRKSMIMQVAVNAAIIGLLCLWIMSINRTSDIQLTGVRVILDKKEGEKDLITVQDINQLIKEELPYDIEYQTVGHIDISTLERMLNADSRISIAEAYVDSDYKLIVEIEQRRPILRVMNLQGDQFYIDQSGAYVERMSNAASRVPVVTGYIERMDADSSLARLPRLSQAYEIVNLIRKDDVLKALVEQIHFEKTKRIVLIPKIGKEKIVIEHVDQLEKKLENLKKFYRHLAKTNGWEKFEEIDISYHNQVVPRDLDNP